MESKPLMGQLETVEIETGKYVEAETGKMKLKNWNRNLKFLQMHGNQTVYLI